MLVTKFEQNETARRLTDAEVAYEAYFGKSKSLVECERYLQVIVNKIKECKSEFALTSLNINESKENIKLEAALKKQFGFKRMHLLWDNSSVPNAYTLPAGIFVPTPGADDKQYRKTKGYYDHDHDYEAIIVVVMNMIRICDLNARETLAIILHEIGHNFDISVCTVTYRTIRFCLTTWAGELQIFLSREFLKAQAWLQNRAPFLARAFNAYQDLIYNFSFAPVDVRVLRNWILDPFSMVFGLLNVQGEYFADSLPAKYGYGPDLATSLNKLEDPAKTKGFVKRNIYKIPVVKTLYDLSEAMVSTVTSFTDAHPYTHNRIIATRKNLEDALEDKHTPAALKPEIRRQIATLKTLENERIKEIFKDQRFVSAIRDSALGALDLPHHELMKAD